MNRVGRGTVLWRVPLPRASSPRPASPPGELATPGRRRHLTDYRSEGALRRRARDTQEYEIDVAQRLAPYRVSDLPVVSELEAVEDELVEKAATLLLVMPSNQRRETIQELLSPNDPDRGRRAVDALIDAAFAAEDQAGRLRRIA